tara:strand:+ start:29 stop:583 length:555 start_codon:yes stop_codon:yes gene_type:complete
MADDAQEQIIVSSQCQIESGNPNPTYSGEKTFGINACNDDNVRFTITHHNAGLSRVEAEDKLQVDVGSKGNKDGTALQLTAQNGKLSIDVLRGDICITSHGKGNITLDANTITLKGRELIQIGDDSTQKIELNASYVGVNNRASSGNITNVLANHKLGPSAEADATKDTVISSEMMPHHKWWVS